MMVIALFVSQTHARGRAGSGGSRNVGRSGSSGRSGHGVGKPNSPGHYTYKLNLKGNKSYVGRTSNPSKRINDHFNGRGSSWTKKNLPNSVEYVRRHGSESEAKRAETREYYAAKKLEGNRVRGAGNTRSCD